MAIRPDEKEKDVREAESPDVFLVNRNQNSSFVRNQYR